MAKKKVKEKTKGSINDILQKGLGINPEDYLKNVILSEDCAVIPISPHIDVSCGGGIKEGSLVLIAGPEKLGKTCMCLQLCANALKIKDGKKRSVFYFDIENRVQPRDLKGISGLDYDSEDFNIYGSSMDGIMYAEQTFQGIETLIDNVKNSVIILDSISMLCTKAEAEYDFTEKGFRPNVHRMTAIFCRKVAQKLRASGNIVVCILHKHANQNASGLFAKKSVESGGTKIKYMANYKFELTYKEDWNVGDEKIGHKVHFKCPFSPLEGSTSNGLFHHRFGTGIDEMAEVIELGKQLGFVEVSGSWYTAGENRVQGAEKFYSYLVENPKVYEELKKDLYEAFNVNS